jgi:serine/threonine protein kinase/tetratricopeptide (TPR) repeat protein
MNARIPDESTIFNAARQMQGPQERRLYLDTACGTDERLRARVEALLRVHDQEQRFLESLAVALPTRTDANTRTDRVERECPGAQIGRYKLLEQIGEGGFGQVFMAEQEHPIRRSVAVKILKPGMDSRDVVARFEAERQTLALMDHANIARVLDGGETPSGLPYFVMELVKGVTITRYCDDHQLPPRERLRLFMSVCHAVQHAHQKGIIHRDLKPTNVLVACCDAEPVAKVIDFGVAKALGQRLTGRTLNTGLCFVGTLEYMSPEAAELHARDIDTRADIYSLGVLLYELLTGTTPLTRERVEQAGVSEVLQAIRDEDPPKPSARLSALKNSLAAISAQRRLEPALLTRMLRGELDWIVMKCLDKDRTRRYETANGLARDIERYFNEEPVEAGPPSTRYRLGKSVRKHRRLLAATAAFALLLVASAVVSTWLAVRATIAERTVGEERDKAVAEKERGDEEAAISKAIIEFQTDLLGQADVGQQPAGGFRNKDVTVRELLDRASKRIEGKFQGQEGTESAIRSTLGKAYLALGDYSEAQKHLDRALAIHKRKHGDQHSETLACMNVLATVWWRRGEMDKAEALYQKVLAGFRAQFGEDDLMTLDVLNNLAMIDADKGRYDESQAKFQRLVAAMRDSLGAGHGKTLVTLGNLARLYSLRGDYAQAEDLHNQVFEGFRTHPDFGPDHPRTLDAMNNLANDYRLQRRYDKAEPLLVQVLKSRRGLLEGGHPDTLTTMHDLAVVYQEQDLSDKADPLFREALNAATVRPGPDHSLTLNIKNGLAVLRARQGRLDEAETLFDEVLQARRKALTSDHPETLLSMHNLGVHHLQRGQYEKAEPLLVEAVQRARTKLTIGHPHTQSCMVTLAALREAQGKWELAEPLHREVLSYFRDHAGREPPVYVRVLARLAHNLWVQRKDADAEPLAREALAIREKTEPDLWTTFDTQSLLGGALVGQAKYEEAEPLLRSGYLGMKERERKIPVNSAGRLTLALERLVELYDAWGNRAEADRWRRELEKRKAKPMS